MRLEISNTINHHKQYVEDARTRNNVWAVAYTSPDGRLNFYVNEADAKPLDVVLNTTAQFGTPIGVTVAAPGYTMVRIKGRNDETGRWELEEGMTILTPENEATTAAPTSGDDPDRRVYWLVADEDQENGVAHKVAETAKDAAEQYFDDHYWRDEPEVGASIWVVREEDAKIFSFQTEEVECECEPEVELNIVQTR